MADDGIWFDMGDIGEAPDLGNDNYPPTIGSLVKAYLIVYTDFDMDVDDNFVEMGDMALKTPCAEIHFGDPSAELSVESYQIVEDGDDAFSPRVVATNGG